MAWIETTPIADAQGSLKSSYDAAIKRSGGVANIVRIMSSNPQTLRASMGFYQVVMFGESPLSRSLRELLATVVSRTNNCHYWVQAHANDLRAEVAHDWKHLVETAAQPDEAALDRFVHQAAVDWRECPLRPAVQALLAFAEKMTRKPWEMAEADVAALRQAGWSDRAVHDVVQVVSYFCYINRVADALGVDPETERPTWGHE